MAEETRDMMRSRRHYDGPPKETINVNRVSDKQISSRLGIEKKRLPVVDDDRPKTREECHKGHRPCPYVGCVYNLYLDVSCKTGSITLNFPDKQPEDMNPAFSCALDVADEGGATLMDLGEFMNLTRERIRQIEAKAIARIPKWGKTRLLELVNYQIAKPGEAVASIGNNAASAILKVREPAIEPYDNDTEHAGNTVRFTTSLLDDNYIESALRYTWRLYMRYSIENGFAADKAVYETGQVRANQAERTSRGLSPELAAIQPKEQVTIVKEEKRVMTISASQREQMDLKKDTVLRATRANPKMSQMKLAKLSGMSQTQVSMYQRKLRAEGKLPPSDSPHKGSQTGRKVAAPVKNALVTLPKTEAITIEDEPTKRTYRPRAKKLPRSKPRKPKLRKPGNRRSLAEKLLDESRKTPTVAPGSLIERLREEQGILAARMQGLEFAIKLCLES